MAVCTKCGEKLEQNAKFCTKCGTAVSEANKETTKTTTITSGDTKPFKILSYIGILWVIGLFCSQKEDSKLKFHVGQGIILSIYSLAISIVSSIINNLIILKIFRKEVTFFGYGTGVYETSGVGLFLVGLITFLASASVMVLAVIGIVNVVKDREKELPIIGKFAFYK